METEITIKNLQKQIPLSPSRIIRIIKAILSHEKVRGYSLSFAFVSDRAIKILNKKFLKRSYATDVLAFDLKDHPRNFLSPKSLHGEIIISTDTVLRNSKIYSTKPTRELILCVIHGILHLMGYDDHTPKDIRKMRKKESELLTLAKT